MSLSRIETRRLMRLQPVRRRTARAAQGLAGRSGLPTIVEHTESATIDHNTLNIVLADDVVLTIPTQLTNGEPFKFIVPQAYAGFKLNGGDATLNGQTGDVGFTTPCAITVVYIEAESNLFIESENYGQTPAP